MEDFRLLLKEANTSFRTADHMLYVTYPLIKENRLIISMTENLNNALIKAMEALLYYDRAYKRVEVFPDDFYSKFDVFKRECAIRYGIDRNYIALIQDLRDLINERKKSKMEFIRNDKYVICSDNYSVKTITIDKLKEYLNISKIFIRKVNQIIGNV
jgi:hypothetical protein